MALGYPGFPLITPEDDPYLTGVESPQWQDYAPDPFTPQRFQGGRGQGILESLAGLEGLNLPTPTSFGEGLAYGLGRGLGASGTRALQRRQRFEEEQKLRQRAADAERLAATREFRQAQGQARTERGKVMRERIKEDLQTKREEEKYNRENPALTEKDIADNRWLAEAGFSVGSRPPERIRAIIAESKVPESPKQKADRLRREGVEQRQIDAANRAASAAELAANNAKISNINKLSDDARDDPNIKGFPAVQDSYRTGEDAAKRGNSAGDIILMRMIAKATDPTTGVREEEFRTFEGAQGTLARYGVELTSAMWGGGKLTPAGRAELRSILQGIYDRKSADFGAAYDYHSGRARRLGYPPEDVIRDYRTPAPGAQPQVNYKPGGWFDANRKGTP